MKVNASGLTLSQWTIIKLEKIFEVTVFIDLKNRIHGTELADKKQTKEMNHTTIPGFFLEKLWYWKKGPMC